jgi:hypothetical protein
MNANFYYIKYLKYKSKYLKYKEQIGGALGTVPFPEDVTVEISQLTVSDLLRNYNCNYAKIFKYFPDKLECFAYNVLQEENSDKSKHQITINDLRIRGFPPNFFLNKNYPITELIEGGYLHFKLIENGGFTFRDMKEAGILFGDLKLKSGYGRVPDKNTPEILQAIKIAGYNIKEFSYNIPLEGIINAGFTLPEIMSIDKFSKNDLLKHFSDEEISNVPDIEYTKEEILNKIKGDFHSSSNEKLKGINNTRKNKINLSLIKDDVPIIILFKAGYSLEELKRVGFTSSKLIRCINDNPGFLYLQLLKPIFTICELLEDKTEIEDIIKIGYNICELKDYGFGLEYFKDLIRENTKLLENLSSCYTLKELLDAGFADLELKILKLCNYSKEEILSMDYTLDKLIKKYGIEPITADVLKYFSINDIFKNKDLVNKSTVYPDFFNIIKQKIIDLEPINPDLLTNELTISNLFKIYKLTYEELISLGFNIKDLPESIIYFIKNGKNLVFFKENNFKISDLRTIGRYTAHEFKLAGYTVEELRHDFNMLEIKDAYDTISEMKDGGISPLNLFLLGFDNKKIKKHITPDVGCIFDEIEHKIYQIKHKGSDRSIKIKLIKEILAIEADQKLKLYFLSKKEIALDLIFDAMIVNYSKGSLNSLLDELKFIFTPKEFVKSKIPMNIYSPKFVQIDLVDAGIDVSAYMDQEHGVQASNSEKVRDAERTATTNKPLNIKNAIIRSSNPSLQGLQEGKYSMFKIKETLKYYFEQPFMTPYHPWYKSLKKIDDEVYKTENGLL